MKTTPQHLPPRSSRQNGFTLLESLMASGILLIVVVAVTQAVTAGQANAYEAQQRIAATLAAQELMGRVVADQQQISPLTWNGHNETVGAMTDFNGAPLSDAFNMIGRRVIASKTQITVSGLNVVIDGVTIVVEAFNADGEILASLEHFIPQPAADSLGNGGTVLNLGGGGKLLVR